MPLLRRAFNQATDLLNAPEGSLLLLDEETSELKFVLVRGALAERLINYRIPADEGIAGWVIQNRKAALVRDVRHDHRFSHSIDDEFKFRTQSIIAVPVIGQGKIHGVMEALNQPADEPFSETDLKLLSLICRYLGEILSNVAAEK
jgi:GAF domain-containing protein